MVESDSQYPTLILSPPSISSEDDRAATSNYDAPGCSGISPDKIPTDIEQSASVEVAVNRCPPFCYICGSPATGHHYDVASCNGCRAFFRRSFVAGRRYKRQARGSCNLKYQGRHSLCRACRYKKCIEVGMKTELIQLPKNYDTDRTDHEQIVLNSDPNRPTSIRPIMRDLFRADGGELAAIIGSLLYAETQSDFLRRSTFDPSENAINSLIDLINAPNQLANSQKYKLVAEWPAKQAPPMERHGDGLPGTAKHWMLCDLVLTVEFAKSFNAFKRLSLDDKLVLLRNAAAVNFSMMQSYYSYENMSNTIVFPDGTFPILFTKRPMPLEVIVLCKGVDSFTRSMADRCEYVLLKAIVFTHFAYDGLSAEGRSLLEVEREKHSKVLFNYLNARHGAQFGPSKFADFIAVVQTFFDLADKIRQFHAIMSVILQEPIPRLFDELFAS